MSTAPLFEITGLRTATTGSIKFRGGVIAAWPVIVDERSGASA
jgi:hypothetical protein